MTFEKIENSYLSSFPLVGLTFVYGYSKNSYLVGIFGAEVTIKPWLISRFGKSISSIDENTTIMIDRAVKPLFLKKMNDATEAYLQAFERLYDIKI